MTETPVFPFPLQLAFATCTAFPDLENDLIAVPPLLAAHGITVTPVIWDSDADWAAFDAVLIRTTWDYWGKYPAFLRWFDQLETLGIPVFNDPATVRWNSDKRYLLEMAARGVAILPTALIEREQLVTLDAVLDAHGWPKAVIKPSVSAGARNTHVVHTGNAADSALFADLVTQFAMLVQPYRDSIEHDGELSLLFFNGSFSHAVQKVPKTGDFRVQPQHGGLTMPYIPSDGLIAQAEKIVRSVTPLPVYARVDGLLVADTLELMELELIEPALFVSTNADAADRLASALLAALHGALDGLPQK